MSFWTGVLLGFIAGWVAEWIIDWNYWRRRTRIIHAATGESAALRSDLEQCRTETARLQNDLTATATLAQQRASEVAILQAALDNARAEPAQVRQQLSEREERIAGLETVQRSDLAEIERLKSASHHPEQEPVSMQVAPETTLLQEVSAPPAAAYATARLAEDDVAAELARLRAELEEERRVHMLLRGSRRDPFNPVVAAAPPAQTGGTGTGGTGTSTGGADVPAALPRTGGAGVPWGALAALAAVLLGSGVWMRLCPRR